MTARVARVLMFTTALVAAGAFTAIATPGPSQESKKEATIAGRWTLAVDAAEHGATTMGLSLRQEGTRITGSFAHPHGESPVSGTFAAGTLTLATTGTGSDGDVEVTFSGKLNDDGTLSGSMSSAMGDMTWTATRIKDK